MTDETTPTPEIPAIAEPTPARPEASVLTGTSEAPAAEAPAPEAVVYTDFKLPEGTVLDEPSMKAATDLFRESGLSQETAQKFIDLATSREKALSDSARAAASAGLKAFTDLQTKWVSEIKADPEVGGARLEASMALAARAIDRLGVPGLREALDLTGAGNNPAVVKAFVRLGQMVSEDRFAPARDAAPAAPLAPARAIYGADGPRQSTA
jgi:hypothetical protein